MSFGEQRTGPGCPVCGSPVASADAAGRCADPGCRWVLYTAWAPGPGDREGFERRLAEARLAYDLRAAALVGDRARRFVRGEVDEERWTRAREEALRQGVPCRGETGAAGPGPGGGAGVGGGAGAVPGGGGGLSWGDGDGQVGDWTRAYAAPGAGVPGAGPSGTGYSGTEGSGTGGTPNGPRAESVLAEALGRMPDAMAVIEADPAGVSLLYVKAGDLDTPDPLPFREFHPWREFAPMLSEHPDEVLFQVAGGLSRVDRAALTAELDRWLTALIGRVPAGLPVLLVCAAPRWTLPEQAVGVLRRARPDARVASSVLPVAEELPRAVARRPLRAPYGLIVAEERPEGVVPVVVPLFPAGSTAGAEAHATVTRGPGGDGGVVLAVVVGDGLGGRPAPGSHHAPVSIARVKLPPGTSTVRAVLDGPGRVRWLDPAETEVEARTLEELYAQTRAAAVATGHGELLCAVELGGPPARAARRRELVAGLLDLLASGLPDRVRVAVCGYYEHSFRLGEGQAPVTGGVWITDPESARQALAALPPATGTWQDDAAPLEDALTDIVQRLDAEQRARHSAGPWPGMPETGMPGPGVSGPGTSWPGMPGPAVPEPPWPGMSPGYGPMTTASGPPPTPVMPPVGVPRTLLVVAGRPPHPRRQGQDPRRELAQPCPRKQDWQAAYEWLRRAGMRFVAVLDEDADHDDAIWRALGADHLAVADDLEPRDLAEALNLLPPDAPSLPFPLRGDHP